MKNRKTKNNKEKLCVAGMLLLVIAALFFPQIIFEIQDRYRMVNTEVEARESPDIFQLNLSYEEQLGIRMSNFLKANQKMVTGLDYDVTEGAEQAGLLETIMYQEWFYILYDYSITVDSFYYESMFSTDIASSVQDCKKYIVYGSNYEPLLFLWYFDIYLPDIGTRMQLVVDTEDDTVYYIRLSFDEQQERQTKFTDAGPAYVLIEYIMANIPFYYSYYEADSYEENLGYGYDLVSDAGNVAVTGSEQYDIGIVMDESQYKIETAFPYGDSYMTFFAQAAFGDGVHPEIIMGIREIGELIPEMMQN